MEAHVLPTGVRKSCDFVGDSGLHGSYVSEDRLPSKMFAQAGTHVHGGLHRNCYDYPIRIMRISDGPWRETEVVGNFPGPVSAVSKNTHVSAVTSRKLCEEEAHTTCSSRYENPHFIQVQG